MDFVRLGPAYNSAYIPDVLIENYNSLIWTERFQDHGEFELKSFDVDGLKALLPEDTMVSHLDTREVMMVETHEIEDVGEGADARPQITVKGRSATTILESRWIEATYQTTRRMRMAYSATSAACVIIYNVVDNASARDLTRGDTSSATPELNDYAWTTYDVIPNIAVTESVASEGAARWFLLSEGIVWPQLQKILVEADIGLRMIRPVDFLSPGTVVTVNSALASRGQVNRIASPDVKELQFNVYGGVDRSSSVQLSQLQGHLDNPKYLYSGKDYKTGVEIMSGAVDVSDVYRNATEAAYTGWRRRIMPFDGGTPEIPPAPEQPTRPKRNATTAQKNAYEDAMDKWVDDYAAWKNKRAAIISAFRTSQAAAALRVLKEQRRVNMFSGDMSALSPYKYKVHYDLGDTVMLYGDYGMSAKMLVAEYVRTEDNNGDRGFPGLVEP